MMLNTVFHLEFIKNEPILVVFIPFGQFLKVKTLILVENKMNILILLVISVQAIKIPVYKRPAGTDQTIPLNLWNVRRYNWDSQENFHIRRS